jgi:hypothetical protein
MYQMKHTVTQHGNFFNAQFNNLHYNDNQKKVILTDPKNNVTYFTNNNNNGTIMIEDDTKHKNRRQNQANYIVEIFRNDNTVNAIFLQECDDVLLNFLKKKNTLTVLFDQKKKKDLAIVLPTTSQPLTSKTLNYPYNFRPRSNEKGDDDVQYVLLDQNTALVNFHIKYPLIQNKPDYITTTFNTIIDTHPNIHTIIAAGDLNRSIQELATKNQNVIFHTNTRPGLAGCTNQNTQKIVQCAEPIDAIMVYKRTKGTFF